jgi:Putative zinc-finger
MATDDREQQFERALARHLRDSSPDAACPDAEKLAAYQERSLSLDEMARYKQHIAGCSRCQETLALVEQSEHAHAQDWEDQEVPVPMETLAAPASLPAVAAAFKREEPALTATPEQKVTSIAKTTLRRPLRWAVPLGAVAAAVIVWVGMHERDLQRSRVKENVQIAQNQRAPQVPASTPEPPSAQTKIEKPAAKAAEESRRANKPAALPSPAAPFRKELRSDAIQQLSPPPPEEDAEKDAGKQKSIAGMLSAGNVTHPNAPTPAAGSLKKSAPSLAASATSGAAAANRARDEKRQESKKVPMPQSSQSVTVEAQPQAPPPSQTTESVTVESPAQHQQARQSAQSKAADAQQEAANNAVEEFSRNAKAMQAAGFLQTAARDRRYILAPGQQQAWRVGDQGSIFRTTNLGKTWKAQYSGVTVELISGSAPSADVCWLIGKAGTILLTTDGGKHWKQISSPISDDLDGIHATDALHASVWDSANHKSFETSDGGATWTPTSNE